MTAREPIAPDEALDFIQGALWDTKAALLTVHQLAAMGTVNGGAASAALLHDANARIIDGLVPLLEAAHAAAIRLGRAS
ncbi:MAG: hypothetical protein V3V60_08720 [Sphingomonas aquatilis]|uniref:hypothetical protein n=1 Tax=Sphingomonas aquatilis TaxID=93063 RepID=UPI002F2BAA7C